jgi:hypothetical protein
MIIKDAQGNTKHYRGGSKISKKQLLESSGVFAAIDDGLLNVEFQVKSFRIIIFDSMGNAIREESKSGNWSDRQKTVLNRLSAGKTFFITQVHAVGPDGIERELSGAMEVSL